MARITGNSYTEDQNFILSTVASIARLENRSYFHNFIGRFRRASKDQFHRNNIKTVSSIADRIGSKALASLAREAQSIIS